MSKPRFRKVATEHTAKGMAAEERFKAWLNDSRLPFVYCTQDIPSVPEHFMGALKRPDYLVALPFVGSVAFDVKAKSIYDGRFIFDVDEVARLLHFDEIFRITTFFACLDPDESGRCWWFRLGKIAQIDFNKRRGVLTIEVPLADGLAVNMDEPLQHALRDVLLLV